jgi:hypothetical protein
MAIPKLLCLGEVHLFKDTRPVLRGERDPIMKKALLIACLEGEVLFIS